MGSKPDVLIYDTTLRDGTQGEGFQLSVDEKLQVAEILDDLGVAYIEGGWPGSNPRDEMFFEAVRKLNLTHARLTAFGATRRASLSCDEDASIQALLRSNTPAVTVFGKSWTLHVATALRIAPEANLELIHDTVSYLKKRVDTVVFDAEHFFDGYADSSDYAMAAIASAVEGGADVITLCDTNGGTLPSKLGQIVGTVVERIGCPVGIHTHNDSELAVANSLMAVEAGATMVQGTINGVGERCGNANLISVIAGLELKMGKTSLANGGIERLTHVSRAIDELANRVPWTGQPYVGNSAFAHKGGVHVSAVTKDSRTYQHIEPEAGGNQRRILVSDLSGKATIFSKMADYGVDISADDPRSAEILERIKALENEGYQYEGAEGSLRLLVDEVLGERRIYFSLEDIDVQVSMEGDGSRVADESRAVARVRVRIGVTSEAARAAGNGPVHAMDRALRKVVNRLYPQLQTVRLIDYKVRILSGPAGTDSIVRVLIQSTDGESVWGTVGASTNIIEASWQALVEALEFKLRQCGVEPLLHTTDSPR